MHTHIHTHRHANATTTTTTIIHPHSPTRRITPTLATGSSKRVPGNPPTVAAGVESRRSTARTTPSPPPASRNTPARNSTRVQAQNRRRRSMNEGRRVTAHLHHQHQSRSSDLCGTGGCTRPQAHPARACPTLIFARPCARLHKRAQSQNLSPPAHMQKNTCPVRAGERSDNWEDASTTAQRRKARISHPQTGTRRLPRTGPVANTCPTRACKQPAITAGNDATEFQRARARARLRDATGLCCQRCQAIPSTLRVNAHCPPIRACRKQPARHTQA